jgi:hypothetical protein
MESPTSTFFSNDNSKLFIASHTEVIVVYRLQDVLINVLGETYTKRSINENPIRSVCSLRFVQWMCNCS